MELRFIHQPYANRPNLVDFIDHAQDKQFDELLIATAWAKKSGLGRVYDAFSTFRAQGGRITLIVGVSEGGATKEGLELSINAADAAYVFHDPQRTFHPKVYFTKSATGARSLLVGSSNLTAGGLGWNFEASIWADWNTSEEGTLTDEVEAWFDSLIGEKSSCRLLTQDLIEQMEKSNDIVIGSETRARRVQKKTCLLYTSDAADDIALV